MDDGVQRATPSVGGSFPRYLVAAGIVMGVLGLFNLLGYFLDSGTKTTSSTLGNMAASLLLIGAGAGLVLHRRWGWVAALIASLGAVSFGVFLVRLPGDITQIGTQSAGMVLFLFPGAVLLLMLLLPKARSWLLHPADLPGHPG